MPASNSYLSLEAASSASRQVLPGDITTAAAQEVLLNVFVDGQALNVTGIMDCAPKLWVWVRRNDTQSPAAALSSTDTKSPAARAYTYSLKWILQKSEGEGTAHANANAHANSNANSSSPADKSSRKSAASTPAPPFTTNKAAAAEAEAEAKWKACNAIIERLCRVRGHPDQRDPSICHLLFDEDNISLAVSSEGEGVGCTPHASCQGITVLTLSKVKIHSSSSSSSSSSSEVSDGAQIVVLLGEPSSTANTPTKLWGLTELRLAVLNSEMEEDVTDVTAGNTDFAGDDDIDRDRRDEIFLLPCQSAQADAAERKLVESLALLTFNDSDTAISSEESLIV